MPRSPKDNELIRQARRAEIFRAAGHVFAKKGFAATKIADIAAEANLSHGLLYHYFRSKEEVYEALFDQLLESRPNFEAAVLLVPRAIDRLERRITFWLEKSVERPELTVMVTQALTSDNLPPRVREVFRRFSRESFDNMVADIEEAQAAGDADPDTSADELATALTSLVRGLATMRFVRAVAFGGGEFGPDIGSLSVKTVMRLLQPPRESTTMSSRTSAKGLPARAPSPRKTAAKSAPSTSKKKKRIQKEKTRAA
jgi:AcrR family transcriptional regulator